MVPVASPVTCAAKELAVVVPLPSLPETLDPQHNRPRDDEMAHEWLYAAEIARMSLPSSYTRIGTVLLVDVPLPSLPEPFAPQHNASPAVVTAQLCSHPADTDATPDESPATGVGVDLFVVFPFPSLPEPFAPQHSAAPSEVTAHVW